MSIRYDEKGKFFSTVVAKEPVPVIVQTLLHRVEGNMYTRPEDRIKDALNEGEKFVAVTQAAIYNSQGSMIYEKEFILINSEQIVWMIPIDEKKSE